MPLRRSVHRPPLSVFRCGISVLLTVKAAVSKQLGIPPFATTVAVATDVSPGDCRAAEYGQGYTGNEDADTGEEESQAGHPGCSCPPTTFILLTTLHCVKSLRLPIGVSLTAGSWLLIKAGLIGTSGRRDAAPSAT